MDHRPEKSRTQTQPVGGEIIPIETTSLLIASVQTNLAWIVPVVLASAGVTAYKLRRT